MTGEIYSWVEKGAALAKAGLPFFGLKVTDVTRAEDKAYVSDLPADSDAI